VSTEERKRRLAAAMRKLQALEMDDCINPEDPTSRPYAKQQEIIDAAIDTYTRCVVAANQTGKSQLGGREVSWLFQRKHPTFNPQKRSLKILVIGRVGEQVESELWRSKIKPFLPSGSYKEIRSGNSLRRVEAVDDDVVIIFMSHHDVNSAREKAQGYVADFVWVDEMPDSVSLLSELQTRVQANNGRMLVTFTPLLRNPDVKRWVESMDPTVGKKFVLFMLDNPIYKGREDEILARYSNLPEAERRCRLFGEWFAGEFAVYDFTESRDVSKPNGHSPGWRHIEVIDPAASGKAGLLLLAEDPHLPGRWWVVLERYINGAAASDLLKDLEKITSPYNIVRRVSDPHEAWFIKEAAKRGRVYMGVYKKNDRKKELIKNVQESLYEGRIQISPWCRLLIEEFVTCQWSETGNDKIVGASRFHLLDCLQYALDNLPKPPKNPPPKTYHEALKMANKQRKIKENKIQMKRMKRKNNRWRRNVARPTATILPRAIPIRSQWDTVDGTEARAA